MWLSSCLYCVGPCRRTRLFFPRLQQQAIKWVTNKTSSHMRSMPAEMVKKGKEREKHTLNRTAHMCINKKHSKFYTAWQWCLWCPLTQNIHRYNLIDVSFGKNCLHLDHLGWKSQLYLLSTEWQIIIPLYINGILLSLLKCL